MARVEVEEVASLDELVGELGEGEAFLLLQSLLHCFPGEQCAHPEVSSHIAKVVDHAHLLVEASIVEDLRGQRRGQVRQAAEVRVV